MLIIGLTGGIGSGKSVVANLFSEKGIAIIDTDLLAREITQPDTSALQKISEKFGPSILLPDHSLDRSKLRTLIFANKNDREWLEQLLHPLIRTEMKYQAQRATSPYCIVVIPLLFETTPNPLIQRVLVVDAAEDLQISRTILRDQSSPQAVSVILESQVKRAERLRLADDIIYNDGIMADLKPQVDQLHEKYLLLAKKQNF